MWEAIRNYISLGACETEYGDSLSCDYPSPWFRLASDSLSWSAPFLCQPFAGKRRADETDSGVAGTQRFFHNRQYLFPSGLLLQDFLRRSHDEWPWNEPTFGKWGKFSPESASPFLNSWKEWNSIEIKDSILHKKTAQRPEKERCIVIGGAGGSRTHAPLTRPKAFRVNLWKGNMVITKADTGWFVRWFWAMFVEKALINQRKIM